MKTPTEETHNRLFIVIHHLAIDGVSWRILLDDLELLVTGLKQNKKPEPGLSRVHTVSGIKYLKIIRRVRDCFHRVHTGRMQNKAIVLCQQIKRQVKL
jgi:NRPS condensation-like uncharacterized protein